MSSMSGRLARAIAAASLCTAGALGWACGGSAFTVAPQPADAGVTYCASHAGQFDFCSDFDEGGLPEAWDTVSKTGASSVAEDNTDWTSPPLSVSIDTPPLGAAQPDASPPQASAALVKRGLPRGVAHLAFDVRIGEASFPSADPTEATGQVELLNLGFGRDYNLSLALHPDPGAPYVLTLTENLPPAGGKPTPLKALPQISSWSHVKIDVALGGGGGGTLTVAIDANVPQIIPLGPPATALLASRTMTLGSSVLGACGGAKLRFDNVTWSHGS